MFEPQIRFEPIPRESYAGNGATLSLAPPMARYSLRARQVHEIESLLGTAVPHKIGTTLGNVICLGPDEWMLRDLAGAEIPLGADLPVAITDVSDRAICIIIDGPRAAQILMAGCPLDLDNFAMGRATRTIYETVEIILIRTAHDNFHIEVWRSFAPWLWTALTTASGH